MKLKVSSGVCGCFVLFLLLFGAAGCIPGTSGWLIQYSLDIAADELHLLAQAVPIEQGLDDPNLTQDQRDKLRLVVKIRDYGENVVGLNAASTYRTFVNLNGAPLVWSLTGARKDAMEVYLWQLPIVGPMTYLNFFEYDTAIAARDQLVSEGYDTFIYRVDAFSTLGILPDPVSTGLLNRDVANIADTILHELLHNTIWSPNSDIYSESLATFVGRTAGLGFLAAEFGDDSPLIADAVNDYEDGDRVNTFLAELADEARALYAMDIPSDEKIARREEVFEAARQRFAAEVQPLLHNPQRYGSYATLNYNNAFLVVNVRYNSDMDVFAAVHESVGRDWPQSLEVFDRAARADDPFAFLREYLAAIPTN